MSKLSCDVVRDLVPTYVDGICSADTKTIVEQHLQECSSCKNLVEMIRETEIVTEASDIKEIDYMRKIKKSFTIKNIICIGALMLITAAVVGIFIQNYGIVPLPFYYILVPVWMLLLNLVSFDYISMTTNTKQKGIMTGIGCGMLTYTILLEFLVVQWSKNDNVLAGTQLWSHSVLHMQLVALIILQLLSVIATWIISIRTGNSHIILMNINIVGCALSLLFSSLLRQLSEMENFVKIRNISLIVILLEGVVITGVLLLLNERKRKRIAKSI